MTSVPTFKVKGLGERGRDQFYPYETCFLIGLSIQISVSAIRWRLLEQLERSEIR